MQTVVKRNRGKGPKTHKKDLIVGCRRSKSLKNKMRDRKRMIKKVQVCRHFIVGTLRR